VIRENLCQNLCNYKLVVFDLDGTLANTVEDLANATNYGLEKAGLKTYPVEDYKQMVGSGIVNLVKRAMSPDIIHHIIYMSKEFYKEK